MAAGWDAIIDHWLAHPHGDGPFPLFFHPRQHAGGTRAPIPWDAFPKVLTRWFEDDPQPDEARWAAAETLTTSDLGFRRYENGHVGALELVTHRQQDEYCEWHVDRDQAGHISRVAFTSEGPEYWEFLANGTRPFLPKDDPHHAAFDGDLGLVLELYRESVDPSVQESELVWPYDVVVRGRGGRWALRYPKGSYNGWNVWNTTRGCMHLTHPANSLQAEVALAADASIPYADAHGADLQDVQDLICCAAYGDPNRSSDPIIGAGVNGIARTGVSVSLANPVGLYIADADLDHFRGPAGEQVAGAWQVKRGDASRREILRAVFAAPDGATFSVDQMRADGVPIGTGGQIADAIQMERVGLGLDLGAGHVARSDCQAKCCIHPQHRSFRTIVPVATACDQVDWSGSGPAVEAPAAAPEPALAEEAVAPEAVELVEPEGPLADLVVQRR